MGKENVAMEIAQEVFSAGVPAGISSAIYTTR